MQYRPQTILRAPRTWRLSMTVSHYCVGRLSEYRRSSITANYRAPAVNVNGLWQTASDSYGWILWSQTQGSLLRSTAVGNGEMVLLHMIFTPSVSDRRPAGDYSVLA